jgi:hypothetical protein
MGENGQDGDDIATLFALFAQINDGFRIRSVSEVCLIGIS